jgi:hypothetical protein
VDGAESGGFGKELVARAETVRKFIFKGGAMLFERFAYIGAQLALKKTGGKGIDRKDAASKGGRLAIDSLDFSVAALNFAVFKAETSGDTDAIPRFERRNQLTAAIVNQRRLGAAVVQMDFGNGTASFHAETIAQKNRSFSANFADMPVAQGAGNTKIFPIAGIMAEQGALVRYAQPFKQDAPFGADAVQVR